MKVHEAYGLFLEHYKALNRPFFMKVHVLIKSPRFRRKSTFLQKERLERTKYSRRWYKVLALPIARLGLCLLYNL
jgi:hypothetical protein